MAFPNPMGGPPAPAPPGASPGVPQPPAPVPVPPVGPPQGGPQPAAAAAPPSTQYVDLSLDMKPHWQIVDWAHRQLKKGLRTQGFYQEGEARAQLVGIVGDLEKLIARYAHKKKEMGPSAGPVATRTGDDLEFSDDAGDEEHEES